MRLFITGVFVRAARNARLTRGGSQSIPASIPAPPRARWASTSTTGSGPFSPYRSKPSKASVDATTPESRFLDHLQNDAEDKKIVTSADGLSGVRILNQAFVFDETSNASPSILDLVGRELYNNPNHPICITRRLIESVFNHPTYKNHVATNPVVTVKDNFDVLGFPKDHPGRSRTDTYYIDSTHVLRTHTSAHQHAAFEYMGKNPEVGYTICADVYRRDSIDRSHFPVFHQMEGAHLWAMPEPLNEKELRYSRQERRYNKILSDLKALPQPKLMVVDPIQSHNNETNPIQVNHDPKECEAICEHLQRSLEILVAKVFTAAKDAGVGNVGDDPIKVRWIEAYFPFTSPSYELEVWWQGEWLEILGCGVTQQSILNNAGLSDRIGWAWGIGIERLAMLLFGIPDIRLFWSKDDRFLSQFKAGEIRSFAPFSKYPTCYKDVAFWLPKTSPSASPISGSPSSSGSGSSSTGVAAAAGGDATKSPADANLSTAFHENDFMEIVRDVAGPLAEDVRLVDEYVNRKTGRKSLCYRINYRSLERTLTNEEVNKLHEDVKKRLVDEFEVTIR